MSPTVIPETLEVKGTNFCDIGFAVDSRAGRIKIISVIDNLVKGAAGQAVQNLNLMFGLEETSGLDAAPWPI
jgi:N-acetyl-gamma-glutamyl-phosphate reductase